MRIGVRKGLQRGGAACLAVLLVLLASCGVPEKPKNLVPREETEKREVNFFSPMEKTDPNAENVARTASDLTIAMAEERLGVSVAYRTYTAENASPLQLLKSLLFLKKINI